MRSKENLCKFAFHESCLGVWGNDKCLGDYKSCEEYKRLQIQEQEKPFTPMGYSQKFGYYKIRDTEE